MFSKREFFLISIDLSDISFLSSSKVKSLYMTLVVFSTNVLFLAFILLNNPLFKKDLNFCSIEIEFSLFKIVSSFIFEVISFNKSSFSICSIIFCISKRYLFILLNNCIYLFFLQIEFFLN